MKDRPILELLKIALDNKDDLILGLRFLFFELQLDGIISESEKEKLDNYIFQNFNTPSTLKFKPQDWKKNANEPRIEWLNAHISMLETTI
jgi:hypothetical protein